jgi:uncharacterized protein with FMN-binding domain
MKHKNLFKLVFDLILLVLFGTLYHVSEVNLALHEIAGLVLFALFAVHLLYNWKWIASVGKRFFTKACQPKLRFQYWMNVLLLLVFVAVGVSGVLCSVVVFPREVLPSALWKQIHLISAAISLILLGVHVGLHWNLIRGVLKKHAIISEKTQARLAPVLNVVITVAGVMGVVSTIGTAVQGLIPIPRNGGAETLARSGLVTAVLPALLSVAAVLFVAQLTDKAMKHAPLTKTQKTVLAVGIPVLLAVTAFAVVRMAAFPAAPATTPVIESTIPTTEQPTFAITTTQATTATIVPPSSANAPTTATTVHSAIATSSTAATAKSTSTKPPTTTATTATEPTTAKTKYKDGVYTGSGKGYKGAVTVNVTIENDVIKDISQASNVDDRPFFNRAWEGVKSAVLSAQSADVDAVTSATYSSEGIKAAVEDALAQARSA